MRIRYVGPLGGPLTLESREWQGETDAAGEVEVPDDLAAGYLAQEIWEPVAAPRPKE